MLRPGAPFVVSFSNRCFPTKAVAVWLGSTDAQHLLLVRAYFEAAGGFADANEEDRSPAGDGDRMPEAGRSKNDSIRLRVNSVQPVLRAYASS